MRAEKKGQRTTAGSSQGLLVRALMCHQEGSAYQKKTRRFRLRLTEQ